MIPVADKQVFGIGQPLGFMPPGQLTIPCPHDTGHTFGHVVPSMPVGPVSKKC